ncbi:hypothetical protein F2Q70_00029219 [Brassica cretica]|uniref:Uncharacterized protein n=1 Tax=Brassica cretica TaxID=69181 RepID=A0A8S9FIH8_BRACR|nr:hypothetical protein F2Q70_00029219 [Brassica cretica]
MATGPRTSQARSLRSDRARAKTRSLRSDRARATYPGPLENEVSGNTKDKIAVRNNARKTTPAATVPMANAYANAKFLRKSKTVPRLFATGSAMKRARDFSF